MIFFNWNFPMLLQASIRCAMMFCSFLSILISSTSPFIHLHTIFTKIPVYNCSMDCGICPIGSYPGPWENQLIYFASWYPVHLIDVFVSYKLLKILFKAQFFNNDYHVIKNLIAFTAIKIIFIGIQHIQFMTDGGLFGMELLIFLVKDVCSITLEQKWPAFYLIIRAWFFFLNYLSSMALVGLVIANKHLAPYVAVEKKSHAINSREFNLLAIGYHCEQKDERELLVSDSDSDGGEDNWYAATDAPRVIFSFI